MSVEADIFTRGSTTYYWSSKFFPADKREDIFKLYSFVRIADNYVDVVPQQHRQFTALADQWRKTLGSQKSLQVTERDSINVRVSKNMVDLTRRYGFDVAWVESFLFSMNADLNNTTYQSIDDSLAYIYGSAEVIGLMIARILELPTAANESAQLLGRAMQYINFVRDIDEDNALGRCYFPKSDLELYGLDDLSATTAQKNPEVFSEFIAMQLDRYEQWQQLAEAGFSYLPKRYRVPVQTASDMYAWTADEIRKDPLVVYKRKVRPKKSQVVKRGAQLLVTT